MSCYCHRIHQTCSHCMAQFESEGEDEILAPSLIQTWWREPLPRGEVVATTQIDHNGNHIEAFIPHSDPDGRPHHLFGNKIIQDQRNAFDHTAQSIARKRALAHRIPFAWRSKSIRDDLRMGTMALFGPTPEGDNS